MNSSRRPLPIVGARVLAVVVLFAVLAQASPLPTTLTDFFLPGSQPGQSGNMQHPGKCDNCHGGYDQAVEPAFSWRGSMMAQAARDPLFYACLAIANQDAPESGDLCIRCHSVGWLEGRSVPTDGSALNGNDREGVQCDFCHKFVKPTEIGVNPYPGDPDYTNDTYPQDQSYLATIDPLPGTSANGMYIADASNAKRGPFVDANAKHQMFYSPFHSDAGLCGTCHDVSNPAYTKDPSGVYLPNDFDAPAPDFDPYSMFPIERTYSEWLMSDYNSPSGIYAPQFGGNKDYVSTCQDCHLRDVTGIGANKQGTPVRDNLPLHDMTGGNTFVPNFIESAFPGEADLAALNAGIERAQYMLENAAALDLSVTPQGTEYLLHVRVTNQTGHKLPSGYPEGRRMWLNVSAYDLSGTLVYESGAYDAATGDLAYDADRKVYEIKPGISESLAPIVNLPAGPSFHFVQNDIIYSDNRIPPRGFTNANFEAIQSPPVDYTYADGEYWDDTDYPLPADAAEVEVTLYYQTLSKEYVTFLRDENTTNEWGNILYDLWDSHGKSEPVAMATESYVLIAPPPSITVTSPNGGETWALGQTYAVTWTSENLSSTVDILLNRDYPGGAWETLFSGIADDGVEEWTAAGDASSACRVKITSSDDPSVSDESNGDFTITIGGGEPVTIFADGFEEGFPGNIYESSDLERLSGKDYWDDSDVRFHSGSKSVYCAGRGRPDHPPYDNDMTAYFQLKSDAAVDVAGYTDVTLSFWVWYETEDGHDFLTAQYWDGSSWVAFPGASWSGTSAGWVQETYILTGFTTFRFRFNFTSDDAVIAEGAYVDDIFITGISRASAEPGDIVAPEVRRVERRIAQMQGAQPQDETTVGASTLPTTWNLTQNSPNPFKLETLISYTLPQPAHVRLAVYDLRGRVIDELVNDYRGAGMHEVAWVPSHLKPGVYCYRLEADGFYAVRKMVLMK